MRDVFTFLIVMGAPYFLKCQYITDIPYYPLEILL